jgi:hypothetical protein
MNLHVPDYLILPFGRAVKSDLQKIMLSAVSADGLYFSTDVPVIFIRKSDHEPICAGNFERHFGKLPSVVDFDGNVGTADSELDQAVLDHMYHQIAQPEHDEVGRAVRGFVFRHSQGVSGSGSSWTW